MFAYATNGQILARRDFYKDGSTWKQGRDEGSIKLQNIAPNLISLEAWNSLTKAQRESWYDARDTQRMTYANGQLVGSQDEAGKIDVTGQLTGFSNTSMGRTQVQVQQGDTLKSLAQRVYGNENLWYVLADANGLQGDDALVAGSSLTVPEVKTSSNDASTFKPYNPSEITGPTTPSLPYIPPPDQGCGAVGMLIMVVVAIVVTVYTAGLATPGVTGSFFGAGLATLGGAGGLAVGATAGAIGGFVGSVAGQAVGSAMGVASFSWRNAAAAGVTSAITAGLGATGALAKVAGALGKFGGSAFGQGAISAVSSNLVNQATGRLAGLDTSFSWKSIAISAVSSGLANAVVSPFSGGALATESGQAVRDFTAGIAGGIVSAHLHKQFGSGDKVNMGGILADAFGSMLANRITGRHRMAAAESSRAEEIRLRYDVDQIMAANGELHALASVDTSLNSLSTDSPVEWQRSGGKDIDWAIGRGRFEPISVGELQDMLLDLSMNKRQEADPGVRVLDRDALSYIEGSYDGRKMNRPAFARHLGAIIHGNQGGVCEREAIHG